jgi:hypothetical protein
MPCQYLVLDSVFRLDPVDTAPITRDVMEASQFDPFRAVRAVDPLPRCGSRRGLAAIPCGPGGRRVVFGFANLALPFGRRAIDLIYINMAQRPGS